MSGEYDVQDVLALSSHMRGPWLAARNLSLLRLRVDISGAERVPVKRVGDYVLARWNAGGSASLFAKGWMIQGCGFSCVLNEPDVEVIK